MEPTPATHASMFTLMQGVITGVVVVGIGLLLFPAFTGDRRIAGKSLCLSNMKQLTTSQVIYSADWDDTIPTFYTFDGAAAQASFYESTIPYSKNPQIFLCGESPTLRTDRENAGKHIDYQHFPLILKQLGKDKLIHLDKMAAAERVAWMHDPILKMAKVKDGEEIETNHPKAPNGFIVSFFDGHAKFVPTLKRGTADVLSTDGVWLK